MPAFKQYFLKGRISLFFPWKRSFHTKVKILVFTEALELYTCYAASFLGLLLVQLPMWWYQNL